MSGNKYEPLSILKPARYDYKIKVRIIRKWRGVTRTGEEFKSFNVILIDNKITRIHAFIPSLVAEDQDKKLKVRSVCIIQYFTVQPYKPDDKFRCLRNENQLIFSKDTKIEDGEDNGTEIPHEAFDFHDHSELKALTKQITYLADVVGIIKNHDLFKTNVKNRLGQMNNQAKFTITDGGSNIKVTFWDKFGEQFEKAMQEATEKPVIVIIASCKVGWWNDDVDLGSVTSTTFYLNYNHHSVMQLRKRLSNPEIFKQVFATSQKKRCNC
ncbi:hypothetical protein POM88_014446 [Heracleum sosnowskyi]|uniref:Replication protein A 70 kDa DNA-binding subunit B/D first OB fold domain-containing protein n=1 Tax=Heracleum sosnowskyi TaxID=360622 RepID=A0AAD8J0D4_9APIA|nr:hypothetical protein POM88_014446 [Heracleum sosnowskyi]